MQDWKVAVLVVIIVVFVVLASLLLFLLYRFGNWRHFLRRKNKTTLRYVDDVEENVTHKSLQVTQGEDSSDMYRQLFLYDPRLRPSPHVLYFIDFQGELLSVDFKKKASRHINTESELQRYLVDTFHPTIEEGNRVNAVTAEMLGLAYVDDLQALVVLDLNRLLDRDDEFGARMTHTAERPLLLARLVPDGADGAVYTTLTRFGYTVGSPPTLRVRADGNCLVAPSQQQQQQEIIVDVAQSRANPMAPSSTAVAPSTSAAPPNAPQLSPLHAPRVASLFSPDVPGLAPVPLIHPCNTHHITTSTPVTVTAATYTVLHHNGCRSVLDAANTAVIEGARLRWDRRQSLVVSLVSSVFAGYQCVIDPVTENGNLLPPRGVGTLAEPIVCQRADALQYTVERVNSTQWLPVERAFYLPAGRWCVRARSLLYSDDSTKSTAKVFTVNVM